MLQVLLCRGAREKLDSAQDHWDLEAGSAGQMQGEEVMNEQRTWCKPLGCISKASLATALPEEVKPEQVGAVQKPFVR